MIEPNLQLIKNEYNTYNINEDGLDIRLVDNILSLTTYKDQMEMLINYFNKEYIWDGMFKYGDLINRIEKNHLLFILFYNKKAIGYLFFDRTSSNFYLYNLYVTKIVFRPGLSPVWFVNRAIKNLPEPPRWEKISCFCEDWHEAAKNVFRSNNFKEIK